MIAIGASTGAVSALRSLVADLPADLPAAVLVVTHTGAHPSVMPVLLESQGPLPARHALHGEPIVPGRIYVAPPDHHMLVEGDRLELSRGPKEHYTRPSIDPLFRSVALSHGAKVIGVVLTGNLDDGTAGLQAIKTMGGTAVVQDPDDAEAPSMPRSALRHVKADHCVRLSKMGSLLATLAARTGTDEQVDDTTSNPDRQRLADEQRASKGNAMEQLQAIAQPSPFSCPDCGGGLWEVKQADPPRYRCHTGHAFSLLSLNAAQAVATEEALRSAIRALKEKEALLQRLAETDLAAGDAASAKTMAEGALQAQRQAAVLQQLVEEEEPLFLNPA
ncbi:MAG: chemotaxis protein CheB [Rubrivivax sp.]|nr:MAG: chemotaxis protein CheB [Rubrivivax sp.]